MVNITWRRFDQSAKQLIVGIPQIICTRVLVRLSVFVYSRCRMICLNTAHWKTCSSENSPPTVDKSCQSQSINYAYTGWVKKVSCCDVIDISKARQYSPNVKYSIILWTVQDLKVSNTNYIWVVKYSMQHNFMTSCLRKLVRVCLAVISLTAFSHRICKHKTIVTKCFTWKYQTLLHFLCRCA